MRGAVGSRAGDNGLSRRQLLGGIGSGAILGLLPHSARASSTFTVMTVGGTWGEAIKTIIADPFCEQNGLSLVFDSRPNAQQIAILQAARGNPSVNAIEIGGPRLGQAILLGLVDKIDPALVPNAKRIYPSLRNDYWAARSIAPWALTYDKRLFSRDEVMAKGWDLLLDPKVKGRVAVPNFGWLGETWLNSVNVARGGAYDRLDAAFALAAKAVKDNGAIIMTSNDQGMKQFSTGEIAVAPFWTGRTLELQRKGTSIDFALVKGWHPYGVGFCAVAGHARSDVAQRFLDFSLSDAAQLAFARQFSYVPTLQDITVPTDMPDSKVTTADFDAAANLDFSQVAKYSDINLERWNKEVAG